MPKEKAEAKEKGEAPSVLLQRKIKEQKLTISEFFEEIPIKLQRSHMQQAYLFDHIQPDMPAFNTNVFKLASQNYFTSHVHSAMEITDQLCTENKDRLEKLQTQVQKMRRSAAKNKGEGQVKEADAEANKLNYFLLSK